MQEDAVGQAILDKILAAVKQKDREHGWNLLKDKVTPPPPQVVRRSAVSAESAASRGFGPRASGGRAVGCCQCGDGGAFGVRVAQPLTAVRPTGTAAQDGRVIEPEWRTIEHHQVTKNGGLPQKVRPCSSRARADRALASAAPPPTGVACIPGALPQSLPRSTCSVAAVSCGCGRCVMIDTRMCGGVRCLVACTGAFRWRLADHHGRDACRPCRRRLQRRRLHDVRGRRDDAPTPVRERRPSHFPGAAWPLYPARNSDGLGPNESCSCLLSPPRATSTTRFSPCSPATGSAWSWSCGRGTSARAPTAAPSGSASATTAR